MSDRPADTIEVVKVGDPTAATPIYRWVRYTVEGHVVSSGRRVFRAVNAAMQDAYRHNPDYADCILVQPRTEKHCT